MGEFAKQFAIYVGLLLMCMNYTIIAPFYPKVAREKGLPLWMIGMMISLFPCCKLIVTPFISRNLQKLGRKRVIIASYVFISGSLFLLSPIEYLDRTSVIILSVFSRILGGIGASCLFNSITTVFISDYPDKMQVMIGRMEAAVGVGGMMGPIVGTALYYINLFAAMAGVGAMILGFSPLAWKMLGEFRDYNVQEVNISRLSLFIKPKVILSDLMIVSFLFNAGFLTSILELHLSDFGVSVLFVSMCFVLISGIYLVLALTGGYIFKNIDSRFVMLTGQLLFVVSYLMFAPNRLIFPNELLVVTLSLPLMAIAQCFCYCIKYIVFAIPYMVRCAVDHYGYVEDDILTDVISSFAVIGTSVGEILGPLATGIMTEYLGLELCCFVISIICFLYSLVFFIGTGYLADLFRGVKDVNRSFTAYSSIHSNLIGSKKSDLELEKSTH